MKLRLPALLGGTVLSLAVAVLMATPAAAVSVRAPAVGTPAPELAGRDLDGKDFRLSQERGKVVVVTFSGEWCGICRSEYPYHRQLQERHAGSPFVLISVESGADAEAARRGKVAKGLTYRSLWDGPPKRDAEGTMAAAWGVTGWPTTFVLDQKGVVRFVDVRKDDLLSAVRQLLTGQPAATDR